jgi:glucosamine-6-phosphate deaminase
MPRVHIEKTAALAVQSAVHLAFDSIRRGATNLGLATGRTFSEFLPSLADELSGAEALRRRIRVVQLDEYVGLPVHSPARFAETLDRAFIRRSGVRRSEVLLLNSAAEDPAAEILNHAMRITAAGGIDLQLLGIGRNGHVAFNEPGADGASRACVVELTASTRQANADAFSGTMAPARAMTLGIADINEARSLLLVAIGSGKAQAVADMLAGPQHRPECPASYLSKHPDLTIVLDEDAARMIR